QHDAETILEKLEQIEALQRKQDNRRWEASVRKSLAIVRARVERLVASLGTMEGCATCRADTRSRFVWKGRQQQHDAAGGPVTCAQCGRTYDLPVHVFSWMGE